MDVDESIRYLGRVAGSQLHPIYTVDTINTNIPYFHVNKERSISIYNFEKHDNANRLPFFAQYLVNKVFPFIDKAYSLEGYYNIELHDTYSYLNNGHTYQNCLVWSKRKQDTDVVLIPDLYQLVNYSGKLDEKDALDFNKKKNKIGFYGTTTGNTNPMLNDRIQTCMWSLDHQDVCDFYITKIAQMTAEDVMNAVPGFKKVSHPYVNAQYLYNYKFLLDIPGNTCSWDRVPTVLNSKSLLFKWPCTDMCWYYPLLHSKEHYVAVDRNNIISQYNYYMANQQEAISMTQRANKFTNNFLGAAQADKYMVALFEEAVHLHGR